MILLHIATFPTSLAGSDVTNVRLGIDIKITILSSINDNYTTIPYIERLKH